MPNTEVESASNSSNGTSSGGSWSRSNSGGERRRHRVRPNSAEANSQRPIFDHTAPAIANRPRTGRSLPVPALTSADDHELRWKTPEHQSSGSIPRSINAVVLVPCYERPVAGDAEPTRRFVIIRWRWPGRRSSIFNRCLPRRWWVKGGEFSRKVDHPETRRCRAPSRLRQADAGHDCSSLLAAPLRSVDDTARSKRQLNIGLNHSFRHE